MQQALMEWSQGKFMDELNEHLRNGCKVVPGTFSVHSVEQAANERTPAHYVLPNGRSLVKVFFCVLELPR